MTALRPKGDDIVEDGVASRAETEDNERFS